MTDFASLDSETRCYALVGKFLSEWAFMELWLKKAIGKALNLNHLQTAVVTSNIQLRDKIHILRTAVHLSAISPDSEKQRIDKVLTEIAAYSTTRNMMAHDAFTPTDDGAAVNFFVIKAKGKLALPDETWDIAKFEEAYRKLQFYGAELRSLNDRLQTAALVNALASPLYQPPIGGLNGLGGLRLLGLLAPASPDSDSSPPTPETDAQTPPSEQE